jgi:hypothetical protein
MIKNSNNDNIILTNLYRGQQEFERSLDMLLQGATLEQVLKEWTKDEGLGFRV